ncbi:MULTISPECIES: Rv0361 family membrane protein [unclassified Brachybacterium]|uniref:Rv0361 family membrane protein n=1 Tax=unclassified Brachybacterium TaxID=2623841 RepID=UPI00403463FB
MAPHPDPAQPPNRSRRLLPWILGGVCALIAIVVVLVLVAGAVWYFALRQTPEDVIEEYLEAWSSADCETFEEITTEKFQGEDFTCEGWTSDIEQQQEEDGLEFEDEIVSSEVDGDRATVRVTETMTDGPDVSEGTFDCLLVRQDGSWLLDDIEIVQEMEEV